MNILSTHQLSKTYASGTRALEEISIDIKRGEIFALLGPNGAGKTTFIGIVSGLINKTSGTATVDGHDINLEWRAARQAIGLVPQEIHLDIFLSAEKILGYQSGFHGKNPNPDLVENILKRLSLWEKRSDEIRFLSGGMKRRVLIAKALITEPSILFLDEPTAGVDVELRKDMWEIIRELKNSGTTVILTTHYIEEAELLADRIGVIDRGKLLLVEEKETLMRRMGEKTLTIKLGKKLESLPLSLLKHQSSLSEDGQSITLRYSSDESCIFPIIKTLEQEGIPLCDLATTETSLEDIFVTLTRKP